MTKIQTIRNSIYRIIWNALDMDQTLLGDVVSGESTWRYELKQLAELVKDEEVQTFDYTPYVKSTDVPFEERKYTRMEVEIAGETFEITVTRKRK